MGFVKIGNVYASCVNIISKMIENPNPQNWRDLQTSVCKIFNEIGLTAEERKIISTPRGKVEVDVYAVDLNSVDKIQYLVECKNWKAAIPQTVVHSFNTVVQEIGANIGFIISRKGLQTGAVEFTKNTNITGLTFAELQSMRWSNKSGMKTL